ncbi:MAG: putative ski2-type helicase [Candidatus Heimdallarchaeota archaeon LC_3]|nr:MAG: putative ski2-type helicase [Candidatus Heimdallarchaeota archaeon LC_3]
MATINQQVSKKSLVDMGLVRVIDLKVILEGTTFELLPLADHSEYLLGLGIVRKSRMILYLSKHGETKILDFIEWLDDNIEKLTSPIFLFRPEHELMQTFDYDIFNRHEKKFTLIDDYKTKEDIWGHISSCLHQQKLFYNPQWAYQFSQRSIFGKQILQFIELMLLNKLALIINLTATIRIANNITATTCLEGESAIGITEGTIIDIESTGIDPAKSTMISYGFLYENKYQILFNHANLNTLSFNLLIQELEQELVTPPLYAYNIKFEGSFFKGTAFNELKPYKDGLVARRAEVYLPNDEDPGKGANIPIWYKLFQSGGDIKKRKLYRRLILLHNRACLINQVALLALQYNSDLQKTPWDKFNFPKELTSQFRHTMNAEKKDLLVFKPTKFIDIYNYKDGFYSQYYDEGYLYKLGLRPAPDHYQKLISSNNASIRMFKHSEAQEPSILSLDTIDMDPRIRHGLEESGIEELYEYQYHAYTQITTAVSCLITAPTGNGKTEAFLLPVLQRILSIKENNRKVDPTNTDSRIMTILFYPTKALSNDQFHKITKWTNRLELSVKQIDGDVGTHQRKKILENPPDILLTTPDWLHYNLHKQEWQQALRDVEIVILDEVHTYSGILGTHLFMLLQRLTRIIGKYQIIGASATVGNPKEFFKRLTNRDIVVVYCKENVAKRPALDILLISPKMEKENDYNVSELVKDLTGKEFEHTVLIFRNSQQSTEFTYRTLTEYLGKEVDIHRGGLTKTHRQDVENKLRNGITKAVVCTSSLELGIDVGDISCILTPLVPINNLYQRIGRAGRRDRPALAILELSNDVISEYYIRHPKEYFTDVTPITFETNNRRIIFDHLRLAKYEKSFADNEFNEYDDILELITKKELQEQKKAQKEEKRPTAPVFSLRSAGPSMEIKLNNKTIATRAFPYAFWEYFPEAIRYIAGNRFKVKEVQQTKRFNRPHYIARVEYLKAEMFNAVRPIRIDRYDFIGEPEPLNLLNNTQIVIGKGKVTTTLKGSESRYGKSNQKTKLLFKHYSYIHRTQILEIAFEEETTVEVLHTLRHLLRSAIQMKLGLQSEYFLLQDRTMKNKLVLYDASEGGNGSIITITKRIKYLFERMYQILSSCSCTLSQGCPKCTFDLKCRDSKLGLDKENTLRFLDTLIALYKSHLYMEEKKLSKVT